MADVPVGALSGGQLQRVYIARALAPRPRLLIMDEPTTGIDARGQIDFASLLADLKREYALTVIFVSHDLRAVTSTCDRIACLNRTLHYHDAPEHLPADLVYRMFACDLEADRRGHGLQSPIARERAASPRSEASGFFFGGIDACCE